MAPRRLWLARLAALAVSLTLAAVVGEVAIRVLVGPPIVWRYPQEHYLRDPELGHRLAPLQQAHTHAEEFRTNSQGIRARELPAGRAPGQRRILALGDSQTTGDGLPLEQTWPGQLETRLDADAPAIDWQVLNAGLSGSAPWQHAILLRRLADHYELDGVLLALYVNDVTPRPERVDAYVVTNTLSRRIGYALKRSALFTAAWMARHSVRQRIAPDPEFDRERRVLTGEPDPRIERGWKDVETSLTEIRDECRARGLQLGLLVLPRRDQVSGEVPGRAYNERALALARRLDIDAVDLLEPLERAYADEGQRLFITWDGHNSSVANRVVAAEAARWVRRAGLGG